MFNWISSKNVISWGKNVSFLFMALSLLYFYGCSTTHNYKVLSFFFDGVPNPNKELANYLKDSLKLKDSGVVAQSTVNKAVPVMKIHPPYQENKCSSCHDQSQMGKLNQAMPEVCYQCHADFSSKFKVLHGPVGGGQCTQCHDPHMSMNDKLLLRTGQSLCLYCHDMKQVLASEVHKDINNTNCTECHNPHGGDDKYILR